MAERLNYCDDQDLRSLPRICERKIKSLAIPYEPLIRVPETQSTIPLARATKRFPSRCAEVTTLHPRQYGSITLSFNWRVVQMLRTITHGAAP